MMKRESFTFRVSWWETLAGLKPQVRLEVYDAIAEYGLSGKLPGLKTVAGAVFDLIRKEMDAEAGAKDVDARLEALECRISKLEALLSEQDETETKPALPNARVHTRALPKGELNYSTLEEQKEREKEKVEKEKAKERPEAAKTPAGATLEERRKAFGVSLTPFVERYGATLIRAFFDYWTEATPGGRKMRYELEKTWETSRRLATWARRDAAYHPRRAAGSADRDDTRLLRQPSEAEYSAAETW